MEEAFQFFSSDLKVLGFWREMSESKIVPDLGGGGKNKRSVKFNHGCAHAWWCVLFYSNTDLIA